MPSDREAETGNLDPPAATRRTVPRPGTSSNPMREHHLRSDRVFLLKSVGEVPIAET